MAHYRVEWKKSTRTEPRFSHWWALDGVITHTSAALVNWIGLPNQQLIQFLRDAGYCPIKTSKECVPPTLKYHKELLSCVEGLLNLLNQPEETDMVKIICRTTKMEVRHCSCFRCIPISK